MANNETGAGQFRGFFFNLTEYIVSLHCHPDKLLRSALFVYAMEWIANLLYF